MSFKVNVIGVVIDAYFFSHVYIYFVFLFWCTGYLVGKSFQYEIRLIYLSFSMASNV